MIGSAWPKVPLSEVVTHRKEFIRISDSQEYMRCRVQLGARGIVPRDRVLGFDVKTKEQQVCRAGELLVAEIDAKLGGFGIVPDGLAGSIVSSHYFLFNINTDRINRNYLGYYIRTPEFQDQVTARGSTNYAAIRPCDVLKYVIPLPDRRVQDRIAAKVDALADKIEEVRENKREIYQGADAMLHSAYMRIVADAPFRKMGELAPLVRRNVEVRMGEEYPELGIRSFGKGTFHKPALDYLSVGTKRLYLIEPGDLLFSNVFAWEGAIAVAQPEDEGRFGSHRFITCVPKQYVVTAEFLRFYFLTDEGLRKIGEASPGGAGRNRTLGLAKLAEIEVPIPAWKKQVWFNHLQTKVRELLTTQQEVEIELNALLPSILEKAFNGQL